MDKQEVPTELLKNTIEFLEECDRWACKALSAYVHKIDMSDMSRLNLDMVNDHQSKIRALKSQIKAQIK